MTSKHTNFRTLLIAGAILLIGIAIALNRTVANLGMGRFDLTEDRKDTGTEVRVSLQVVDHRRRVEGNRLSVAPIEQVAHFSHESRS